MEKSNYPYAFENNARKSYGDLEVVPEDERKARAHGGEPPSASLWEARGRSGNLEVAPEHGMEVAYNHEAPIWISGPVTSYGGLDGNIIKNEPKKSKRRICGLRARTFWILLVIIVFAVAGGVGGGVGGTLIIQNRDQKVALTDTSDRTQQGSNTSSTTTNTSPLSSTSSASTSGTTTTGRASTTSSAPITSGTNGLAANPCPGKNLTTIEGSDDSIFTILCSVDWPSGEKSQYGNVTVEDLTVPSTAYTLKECIADCVNFNNAEPGESPCRGVVYTANLTAAFDGGQDGNCFLKNTIGRYFPTSDTSMAAGILGGGIS
ncbi:hypothetical protein N7526_008138 [Penicillium atrosanguineum]|nr:hypothetical protein N7526_008138 [Penicillium atrosanguineum]